MTVTLQPITRENWLACIALKPKDDQVNFVAPNVFSIAEASFHPDAQTRAIYAGETMVGFVMWGVDTDNNPSEMWIWRLMIDGAQQGKGYARMAMEQVLRFLRDAGHREVFLSYEPKNAGAARFYSRLGFEPTGRVEYGETVVKKVIS